MLLTVSIQQAQTHVLTIQFMSYLCINLVPEIYMYLPLNFTFANLLIALILWFALKDA